LILKKKIVLASTSRYRAELLSRLQLPFDSAKPDTDETPLRDEKPTETALRLSIAKAKSLRLQYPDALIIGSDQVADLNGLAIGKPGDRLRAREQLRTMRCQSLVFHSGLALLNGNTGRVQASVVPTTVRFRDFGDDEIENYLQKENALDCAGSAKSEGLGIALIAAVQSEDPTALIGLPLIALGEMLRAEGVHILS
jgi:septum formation protein